MLKSSFYEWDCEDKYTFRYYPVLTSRILHLSITFQTKNKIAKQTIKANYKLTVYIDFRS
jgi:hypothetical protein